MPSKPYTVSPEKRREYNQRYKERHPERIKASHAATYQKRKAKAKEETLRWQRANPQKVRLKKWRQAGIRNFDWSDWYRLFEAQRGICACCLVSPIKVVDHDHNTGEVRGLLCQACNRGIGQLGDTKVGLEKAVAYLAWSEKNKVGK